MNIIAVTKKLFPKTNRAYKKRTNDTFVAINFKSYLWLSKAAIISNFLIEKFDIKFSVL